MIYQVRSHDPGRELVLERHSNPADPRIALMVFALLALLACAYVAARTWIEGGFRLGLVEYVGGAAVLLLVPLACWSPAWYRFVPGAIERPTRLRGTSRREVRAFELMPALQPFGGVVWTLKHSAGRGFFFGAAGICSDLDAKQFALRTAAAAGMRTCSPSGAGYRFSAEDDLSERVPPPLELENDRFFPRLDAGDRPAAAGELPGGVRILQCTYDNFEYAFSQSRERRIVAWIALPALFVIAAAVAGLARCWPDLGLHERIAGGVFVAGALVTPWYCLRLLRDFLPDVTVRVDGAAKLIREESYVPLPEIVPFGDVRAVFVKRMGRRRVVMLECPGRHRLALTLPAGLPDPEAGATAAAVARELAARLDVAAYHIP